MNKGYKDLAAVLENDYGVGALAATPLAVLWAAADMITELGFSVETAKAQLKALNGRRHRVGAPGAYAPYGSILF